MYQILPDRTESALKLELRNQKVTYDVLKKGVVSWLQNASSGTVPMDLGALEKDLMPGDEQEPPQWPDGENAGDIDALNGKGKSKGKGFQGTCNGCGKWGHSWKYCFMNPNYKGKGKDKGGGKDCGKDTFS